MSPSGPLARLPSLPHLRHACPRACSLQPDAPLRPAPCRTGHPAPPADGALAVLYARLMLPASALLIGAMAGTTLLSGPRMCARVLESPGVEEPLAALHDVLGLGL